MNDLRDQRRILSALIDLCGTASIGDLESATGFHGRRVEQLLRLLSDKVEKLRDGRWLLKDRR